MQNQDISTLADLVPQVLPYDGPHTADTVTDAAGCIAALVRYLNNATRSGASGALADLAALDEVVGSLRDSVSGLEQLLGQLSLTVDEHAQRDGLYDDRDEAEAGATAGQAAYWLGSPARQLASDLAEALESAQQATNHLGNRPDTGPV